jgi:diguanylate cyclase (GGDEF)-like protein
MPGANATVLDVPTLTFVAVGLADLLGLFLVFCWLQERSVRALAWWGSAYFIAAFALTLWFAPASEPVPPAIPEALTLLACGVVWSGIRLFHGRRIDPLPAFAAGALWPAVCLWPALADGPRLRIAVCAALVALYTFAIAREFWRERRRARVSPLGGVVVPALHAAVFLIGPVVQLALPQASASLWLTLFIVQVMIYSVGAAFIGLLTVKDRHLDLYRHAASTDPLTGVLNRRGFIEHALRLGERCAPRSAVTLMMFDLDRFKSINDRYGHATGDSALKLFAEVLRGGMRASDVIGRFGGEEFAAIVPGDRKVAESIGERIRAAFEKVAVTVDGYPVGGTVSIGAASAPAPLAGLDRLLQRADAALYAAKHAGRNRMCTDAGLDMIESVPLAPGPVDARTAEARV